MRTPAQTPLLLVPALVIGCASSALASEGARACLLVEGERVTRSGGALEPCVTELDLRVLREEHVSFQIVVEAGSARLEDVVVEIDAGPHTFEPYVEHFVSVEGRSRTDDRPFSLAFTSMARPADEGLVGAIPDALIPIAIAPPWAPYPLVVEPAERGVLYVEAFIPRSSRVGTSTHEIVVRSGGRRLGELNVSLDVGRAVLPYQAAPAFAYYERDTLERRFESPDDVERELVRVLHRHHLDAVTSIVSEADVERVAGSITGAWFREDAGYRGPGADRPTTLFPIGTYGSLGPPDPAKAPVIDAIASRLPATVEDVFVYAIDETCDSPFGPAWRTILQRAELHDRVKVGHTCHEDPRGQEVDLVMTPAQAFDPDLAREARRAGKQVWIYNGMLPYAGPLMLDVPLTSLTVNGWIAAVFETGRWFYWESIFWDDGNRGGEGPRDVFASAETFHNPDGDTALYDGLLLFPQRMPGFAAHDLGRDGVLPSLRLKALRRGLEDAGLLALAAEVDPIRTARVGREIVGGALDEVDDSSRVELELRPRALDRAREELREIIEGAPFDPRSEPAAVKQGLAALREVRERERRASESFVGRGPGGVLLLGAIVLGLVAFGGIVAIGTRRRRRPNVA